MSASVWTPGTALVPSLPSVAPVAFVPGTVAAPGISIVGDSNSGIWSAGDGIIGVSINGVNKTTTDVNGLTVAAGKLSLAPELTVASAATCDIGAVASNSVQVTGTSNISSFGTNYRGPMYLRFAATLTLTNSANLILPGLASITVLAGDTCTVMPKATAGVSDGWIVTEYTRASLTPPLVGYAIAGANDDITSLARVTSLQGGQLAGFRNKLIGGHFDTNPWQRGTSFTVTVSGTYVADRWKVEFDGTANITVSKTLLATPALINGVWCNYGLKFLVNSKSGNSYIRLVQCIEDVDTLTTLPAVLQTAIQGSGSFAVPINLRQNFGTGGSPSASVITPFTTTLAVTTAMQWLQSGITVPTISGKTYGTTASTSYISVEYDMLAIPAAGYASIALSGLEQGSYASIWEDRRRIELSLCQRYYEAICADGIVSLTYTSSVTPASTSSSFTFSSPKRIVPTVTLYGSTGVAGKIEVVAAGGAGSDDFGTANARRNCFSIQRAGGSSTGYNAMYSPTNATAEF